jgi:hypothetical protein
MVYANPWPFYFSPSIKSLKAHILPEKRHFPKRIIPSLFPKRHLPPSKNQALPPSYTQKKKYFYCISFKLSPKARQSLKNSMKKNILRLSGKFLKVSVSFCYSLGKNANK